MIQHCCVVGKVGCKGPAVIVTLLCCRQGGLEGSAVIQHCCVVGKVGWK